MQIKVFNRFTGNLIFERNAESLRIALEIEARNGADLILAGQDVRGYFFMAWQDNEKNIIKAMRNLEEL